MVDKYDYTVRTDKIRKMSAKKEYAAVAKIADSIDWTKVQDSRLLMMVSEAYEAVGRYTDAKEILLDAYEKFPVGRRMIYKLTELSAKEGNFSEAEDFFREYQELSPNDVAKFVLRYEISAAKGEPLSRLIPILEAYRRREVDERWSYELAKLYHQAGREEECVRLCDEIILWFGDGVYVEKAAELRAGHMGEEKKRAPGSTAGAGEAISEKEEWEFALSSSRLQENLAQYIAAETTSRISEEGFDEDGFATDLGKTREVILPRTAEERSASSIHRALELSGDVVEELDLACIAAATDEEQRAAHRAAAEEVRYLAESELKREPVEEDDEAEEEPLFVEATETHAEAREEYIGELSERLMGSGNSLEDLLREAEQMLGQQEAASAPTLEEMLRMAGEEEAKEAASSLAPAALQEESLRVTEQKVAETKPSEEAAEQEKNLQTTAASSEKSTPEKKRKKENAKVYHCVLLEVGETENLSERAAAALRKMHARARTVGSQAAKIHAVRLNLRGIQALLPKLEGKDLIVEAAGQLSEERVEELVKLLSENRCEIMMVLADAERPLRQLAKSRPQLRTLCGYLKAATAAGRKLEEKEKPLRKKEETAAAEEKSVPRATEAGNIDSELARLEEEQKRLQKAPAMEAKTVTEENASAVSTATEIVREEGEETREQEKARRVKKKRAQGSAEASGEEDGRVSQKARKKKGIDTGKKKKKTMTMHDFAKCVETYALQLECELDDKAALAIYARAERLMEDGVVLSEEVAREITDKAVLLAEKPSLRGVFSGKYNKEGFLILREQHFFEK